MSGRSHCIRNLLGSLLRANGKPRINNTGTSCHQVLLTSELLLLNAYLSLLSPQSIPQSLLLHGAWSRVGYRPLKNFPWYWCVNGPVQATE